MALAMVCLVGFQAGQPVPKGFPTAPPGLCRCCVHARRRRGRRVASDRGLGAAALTAYYALIVVILMNGRVGRHYAEFGTAAALPNTAIAAAG
jgi:hypothetical protein